MALQNSSVGGCSTRACWCVAPGGQILLVQLSAVLAQPHVKGVIAGTDVVGCLLYTSDAADERSSVDLGGCRIIKKIEKAVDAYRRGIEKDWHHAERGGNA